jgi:type III secretion protein N (ATPase)
LLVVISSGIVTGARGGLVHAHLPGAALGDGVRMRTSRGNIGGTVAALANGTVAIAAHDSLEGVAHGDAVTLDPSVLAMPLGVGLLGRSIDARGRALDGKPEPTVSRSGRAAGAPLPSARAAVAAPFWTGVRTIDGLLTIGRGARVGFFGPPGAGKSTLISQIAGGSYADAVVLALVGERGREAQEWLRSLPPRACAICATSDRSAAERVRAANVAMAQAASLRANGLHVLLVLDSLARFASALREIAVAAAEPAGRAGYPASVFASLARYTETAGNDSRGSITLIATVLSDGDERDPISECARSLLDGHVQLSAAIASSGRFPAIDVPASTSRTMSAVVGEHHAANAATVRAAIASLAKTADARSLGIVSSDGFALRAAAAEAAIEAFLQQGPRPETPARTLAQLARLCDALEEMKR